MPGTRTSTIARPRTSATSSMPRPDRDSTLLGDLTRPISVERRLVRNRWRRWALSLVACALTTALLAALFTFPVKNWRHQQDVIQDKQDELAVLTAANDQLAREVGRLRTADGALEAARDELGLVMPGEQRISVLEPNGAPLALPSGWPFDVVAGIIATRSTGAPTAATPAAGPGPVDTGVPAPTPTPTPTTVDTTTAP